MKTTQLRMRISAMTHLGKVRPHNEDCIGIADWVRSASMSSVVTIECLTDEPRLCVVADGLGGHAGGEIASTMVVRDLLQAVHGFNAEESVSATLSSVNKRLYDAMDASLEFLGMGATVVGFAIWETGACLFNVGDSRGYIRSGNYLRLLTIDDTSAFGSTDMSERTGQHGHRITQSLGGLPSFAPIEPHLASLSIQAGDRYLLCSDGLTDMLDQDMIERCLEESGGASVLRLVSAALSEGGEDNISVMIIDFFEESSLLSNLNSESE